MRRKDFIELLHTQSYDDIIAFLYFAGDKSNKEQGNLYRIIFGNKKDRRHQKEKFMIRKRAVNSALKLVSAFCYDRFN